ncbi:MAG: hypothetical protein KDA59_25385 [Planctomycetales bacterium]|nr:hypothetical protein [Planctomycetales bacterium]MCA9206421.1 hypothetical protein [Planctomycetales bacterium]
MKSVSLKLPDGLSRKLEHVANETGQSPAEVVRSALEMYLCDQRVPSALDLAGDVVGCWEGPGDLSTNREHLSGFGE